jgi:pyruvate dehydrogenase E1 component beta subunit
MYGLWTKEPLTLEKPILVIVNDESHIKEDLLTMIGEYVSEKGFDLLKAAPQRVAWENVPVPFSPPLEERALISDSDIDSAIRMTLA